MLNSASTIFTMDLFTRYCRPDASPRLQVAVGRGATVLFVLVGCFVAPLLQYFEEGVFHYIQEFQGFASPGVLACFLFGFLWKRTPPAAAVIGLLLSAAVYASMYLPAFRDICFLNRMAISFVVIVCVMAAITLARPMKEPRKMPVRGGFDHAPAPSVMWLGGTVIVITIVLYAVFW
jgi:SSS family solute:Na+ symporter